MSGGKPNPEAVLLHVYSDKNRGDQGIVFSTINLLENRGYDVRLLSMYHHHDIRYMEDHQQFVKNGYPPLAALFPEPHIWKNKKSEEGNILRKGFNFLFYLLKCQLVLFLNKCHSSLPKLILGGAERESWETARRCSLAVVKGGSFFYGYRNFRSTFFYLRILYHLHFMKKLGLKVVVFPQSMGPWETWISRWFSRRVINGMDAVIVRERLSAAILEKHRISRPPVFILPDVVLVAGKTSAATKFRLLKGELHFVVNARPFEFNDPEQEKRYLQSMVDIIDFLRSQGGNVYLVPQATGPTENEDDLLFLRMIFNRLASQNQVCLVEEAYNYGELIDIYSRMDLVVTTRLHAAIFAMSRCVPSVAVSYHGTKTKGLYQMMGLDDLVLDIHSVSSERLVHVVKNAFDNRENLRKTIDVFVKKSRDEYHRIMNEII